MTSPLDPERLSPAVATLLEEAQRSDRAGQREIARRRYETALYLLRPGEGDPAAAPAIVRRIARSYVDDGQFDDALDCLTAALGMSESLGDRSGIAHAVNLMAITNGHRGDLDEAERLYAQAVVLAAEAGDERLRAMVSQNLGIAASMRGDLRAALDHYASSLVTYRTAGLREFLGPVLNNMGLVYTQLDRLEEAHAAYDEALHHCDAVGDSTHRLLALVNSTDLWLARGDIKRAAELCDTVLLEATVANDLRALGETYKYLGVISRLRGTLEDSARYFGMAYENAMRREDLLLAAETSREQAELYESMGKNRETLQSLSKAHQLYTKLRAQTHLADLKKRISRLETRFFDLVARWASTIESKDAYTLGHCERVADYACALARDWGYDEITMFWFRIGALLHDVGKVAVPSEILNKPGPLNADERAVMETHTVAGYDMLRDIDFPWDVLPLVRGHHERWDGTGYPDRLAGENIAESARIVCVADVFDALTTDRPYRRAFTWDEALTMMAKDAGRMFDPQLFPRFERIMRSSTVYSFARPELAAAS
jgi:putative nucleotidyltransferase with HDIG domain